MYVCVRCVREGKGDGEGVCVQACTHKLCVAGRRLSLALGHMLGWSSANISTTHYVSLLPPLSLSLSLSFFLSVHLSFTVSQSFCFSVYISLSMHPPFLCLFLSLCICILPSLSFFFYLIFCFCMYILFLSFSL